MPITYTRASDYYWQSGDKEEHESALFLPDSLYVVSDAYGALGIVRKLSKREWIATSCTRLRYALAVIGDRPDDRTRFATRRDAAGALVRLADHWSIVRLTNASIPIPADLRKAVI